jgi:hypothetical protein
LPTRIFHNQIKTLSDPPQDCTHPQAHPVVLDPQNRHHRHRSLPISAPTISSVAQCELSMDSEGIDGNYAFHLDLRAILQFQSDPPPFLHLPPKQCAMGRNQFEWKFSHLPNKVALKVEQAVFVAQFVVRKDAENLRRHGVDVGDGLASEFDAIKDPESVCRSKKIMNYLKIIF